MNEILPKNDDSLWKVIKKLIILLLAIGLLALIYSNLRETPDARPTSLFNKQYFMNSRSNSLLV